MKLAGPVPENKTENMGEVPIRPVKPRMRLNATEEIPTILCKSEKKMRPLSFQRSRKRLLQKFRYIQTPEIPRRQSRVARTPAMRIPTWPPNKV